MGDNIRYMTIGCPIEMGVTDISGETGFIVEKSSGEQLYLTQQEAILWSKLLICDVCDEAGTLSLLEQKGLLLSARTPYELMYQLSGCRPMRHGVGLHARSEDGEQFFCISLGEDKFRLNAVQRAFWKYADGTARISDVAEQMRSDGIDFTEKELYETIRVLIRAGAVYLRR